MGCWLLAILLAAPGADLQVLGHRGYAADRGDHPFPENTALSVLTALFTDADGVEVDVVKTADDVLVLRHDDDLGAARGRTRPSTDCQGRVTDQFWAELADCRAQPHREGFTVPLNRLEDVLSLPVGWLVVDVKNDELGVEPLATVATLAAALRAAGAVERTLVALQSDDSIRAANELGLRTCKTMPGVGLAPETVVALVLESGAWAACLRRDEVTREVTQALRAAGRGLVVYHPAAIADDGFAADVRRLRTWGVRGLVTDWAEAAKAALE